MKSKLEQSVDKYLRKLKQEWPMGSWPADSMYGRWHKEPEPIFIRNPLIHGAAWRERTANALVERMCRGHFQFAGYDLSLARPHLPAVTVDRTGQRHIRIFGMDISWRGRK